MFIKWYKVCIFCISVLEKKLSNFIAKKSEKNTMKNAVVILSHLFSSYSPTMSSYC
jgi:hypothetical protein